MPPLSEIGDHDTNRRQRIDLDRGRRELRANRAARPAERQLGLARAGFPLAQKSVELPMLAHRDHIIERRAHHVFQWTTEQVGKMSIAVEHDAVRCDGDRAFVHRLDQDAIRLVGALQREYTVAVGTRDNQRVGFAGANRVQSHLGNFEPAAKFVHFLAHRARGFFQTTGRRTGVCLVSALGDRSPRFRTTG